MKNGANGLPIPFNRHLEKITQDTMGLSTTYIKVQNKLSNQFPEWQQYQVHYWATRIAIISDGADFEITFDKPEDPNSITIVLKPDYGS